TRRDRMWPCSSCCYDLLSSYPRREMRRDRRQNVGSIERARQPGTFWCGRNKMVTNTQNPPKKVWRNSRITMPTVTSAEEIPDVAEVFENCIGCKWTIHVLTQIRRGVRRPGELVRTAQGLSTKVLNERLGKLVRFGVLAKTSYPQIPPRVEYDLTTFG